MRNRRRTRGRHRRLSSLPQNHLRPEENGTQAGENGKETKVFNLIGNVNVIITRTFGKACSTAADSVFFCFFLLMFDNALKCYVYCTNAA